METMRTTLVIALSLWLLYITGILGAGMIYWTHYFICGAKRSKYVPDLLTLDHDWRVNRLLILIFCGLWPLTIPVVIMDFGVRVAGIRKPDFPFN